MLALAQKGTLVQANVAGRAFLGETGTWANPPFKSGIIQAPGSTQALRKLARVPSAQLLSQERLQHSKFGRGLNQISGHYGGETRGVWPLG